MKLKHFLGLVGGLIIAGVVLFVAIASSWFTNWQIKTWLNNWGQNKPQEEGAAVVAISSTGEAMYAGCSYAMPESLAFVSAQSEETVDYGGEVTITAELDNEYIAGAEYEWELDWTWTTSESFADNNNVSDCLEVTVYQGETNTAHIKALKPFGDTALLIVKLKKNHAVNVGESDITVQCKLDYIRRPTLTRSSVSSCSEFYVSEQNNNPATLQNQYYFEFTEGTIRGDIQFDYLTAMPLWDFMDLVNNYITFSVDYDVYEIPNARESVEQKGYYDVEFSDFTIAKGITCDIAMTGKTFALSDFIRNFEQYNDKQKEALYYAWNCAFISPENCEDNGEGSCIPNVEWEAHFIYSYNGVELDDFYDYNSHEFTASKNVQNIRPEIILNNSYVRL